MKKFSRNIELKNLDKCNSILILSNILEDEKGEEISRMVKYLKLLNKEVVSLLFTGKKDVKLTPLDADIKIINSNHINKIFIPKDLEIEQVIDREFDLLIDLTLQENFTLKYINALSKSKLKVGAALNYKMKHGDITIDISKNPTISYLIVQIKHYLTLINQEQNVV